MAVILSVEKSLSSNGSASTSRGEPDKLAWPGAERLYIRPRGTYMHAQLTAGRPRVHRLKFENWFLRAGRSIQFPQFGFLWSESGGGRQKAEGRIGTEI